MTNETDTLDLRYETKYSEGVNAQAIEKELRSKIKGEVRFDTGTKALYATDASNYRQVPIGVVLPKSEEDIINTVTICKKHHAPLLSRGGGTSLTGACCNVAIVIDMTKYYNKVLHIDKEKKNCFGATRNCVG
jgi:FAD/FMN-containing dehydrogenase